MDELPSDLDAAQEAEHIADIVNRHLVADLNDYDDEVRVEGAGGSGIVMSAIFKPFGTRRAIKLPRREVYAAAVDGEGIPEPDPELHALSKLSNQNITKLYDSYKLPNNGGYCVITEYVENAEPLDRFAWALCCSDEIRNNDWLLDQALGKLVDIVFQIVDALAYMHDTAKLIHFDIKPDNILVSDSGIPFITDLGFARDVTKYSPGEEVRIGFTWKYANKSLTDPDDGARISRTPAKAKNIIKSEQLVPAIDLFAFGRTLQQVLKRLEDEYRETIHSNYTFNYLHLIACLCLDGKNAANADSAQIDFVSDQALVLPVSIFRSQAFSNFVDVKSALQRFLGSPRLEVQIPELNPWSASTIKVSDLGITTYTTRVNAIISHPAIQRLSGELQLGMLETVYPSANHTRLQHSLGVYHAVCQYITALYYDPENPTFRVLFNREKCESAILGALVHDIGQTTFGHEMEEVDGKEFSHEAIGAIILEKCAVTDTQGRTIRQIIERRGNDCWGIRLADLNGLLDGSSLDPFDGILHDVLDGHLDADKLDYLIRDSVEARVSYGHGIDYQRFLRTLTTIVIQDGRQATLRLAIKQKGAASAESIALARYQMFQSVYWHHTARAIKAMIITATMTILSEIRATEPGTDLFDRFPFRSAYIKHVIGLFMDPVVENSQKGEIEGSPRRKRNDRDGGIESLINDRVSSPENPTIPGTYSESKLLKFLWKLSTGRTRDLIEALMSRNYYKRVFEIPLSSFNEEGWLNLRGVFQGDSRLELQSSIEKSLMNLLRSAVQDQMKTRASLVEDKALERIDWIAVNRHPFLIDLPVRGWTTTADEPFFVSDTKRRHFRAPTAEGSRESRSLWAEDIGRLTRRAAFFRVYCEPELHLILRRVLSGSDISEAVEEHLTGLPNRRR